MAEPDIVFRNFKKKIKDYGWDFHGSGKEKGELGMAIGTWLGALNDMKGVPAADLFKLGLRHPIALGVGLVSTGYLLPLVSSFMEACIESGIPSTDVLNADPQPENADKERWKKVKGITGFYSVSYTQKGKKLKMTGKAKNVVPATRILLSTKKEIQWSAKTHVTTQIERYQVVDDVPNHVIKQEAKGEGQSTATTHVSIYLEEGRYKLSLNSYFNAPCQVESHINNNQTPITINKFHYDFYGISHFAGSLPGKGMVISGGKSAATEKGTANVSYYFVCY